MTIPNFQELMLPVLQAATDGEIKISDVVRQLGENLKLTSEELSELLPSGRQTKFANRVNWAKSYLGKAGLIMLTRRGYFKISELGKSVLSSSPKSINTKFLASILENGESGHTKSSNPDKPESSLKTLTPDEIIRLASEELSEALGEELLSRILSSPPDFFERLVVQLLVAMGYGGSTLEAGRALGKSGDGGVDGVIDQDALGLDRIYVQAKRYTDNRVSASEIRDFFGSLDRFRASKGIFVTTSSFTVQARETVEMLSKRIVLIEGRQLTSLMIRFNIGCRVEETILIKKVDEDFFD